MEAALKLYEEIFGECFPLLPFRGTEEDEIITTIRKCVDAKKDVYEMGFLSNDPDIIY